MNELQKTINAVKAAIKAAKPHKMQNFTLEFKLKNPNSIHKISGCMYGGYVVQQLSGEKILGDDWYMSVRCEKYKNPALVRMFYKPLSRAGK